MSNDFFDDRRGGPAYPYEQQRMGGTAADIMPGEYGPESPGSYPYGRMYGTQGGYPSQMHPYAGQPPYKMTDGFKQGMDPKLKDPLGDEGPKKPQDH